MNASPPTPVTHPLDFLIIGAQKSATTSLARYLDEHPEIFVPGGKELEFFSDPQRYRRGYGWMYQTFFAAAAAPCIKGEASTHYMMYPQTSRRIRDTLPQVRLIAILRNPIDRAYSHYRMSCMRGRESRDFASAVAADIADRSDTVDENHNYVRFGEYARILGGYLEDFPSEQIRVVFTEELERDPAAVLQGLYAFVGADTGFVPPNLEQRYNVTGDKILPGLDRWARSLLRRLRRLRVISQARFSQLIFWTHTELNIRPVAADALSPEVRAVLAEHFAADVAWLRRRFGVNPPWPDFAPDEVAGTDERGA
ncbi:sulfotransferase family protein [Marichromatium bheemlicum]|uniref:Sulfotransferase n=1 Tax=Marichromatium bheemlicum TaxID=365339 RepID=A0ABX1I753_9GAMM|nr:sulfotransferase [Marichromatium bheemlicum]NKN33384.1 sulfotransferase [Marichromatium bheemlicum]